jgi:hypothetical protein
MNIECPLGSYDPNVEPAKDDVLFKGLFGEIPISGSKKTLQNSAHRMTLAESSGLDLLSRRPPNQRCEDNPSFRALSGNGSSKSTPELPSGLDSQTATESIVDRPSISSVEFDDHEKSIHDDDESN